MHVHLIDGTYELFRAYFGAPSAQAADGREVGATRGLLRSLLALLRDDQVTHAGIAFDTVIESFRNQLFAGYKTGDGIEEPLASQFLLAEEAAHALGLVVWPMRDFEADDALATAAARCAQDPRVDTIYLCSPDKDLYQCVRASRVVVWDRLRDKLLGEDEVIAKLGVLPASVPDYLALVGDSADGIPGLPRWGARSAAAVLSCFGHIDAIPDDPAAWADKVKVRGAAALAEILRSQRAQARLYRTLATLRVDVPLAESLDDLAWRGARKAALEELCARIGERGLLARVPRWRSD